MTHLRMTGLLAALALLSIVAPNRPVFASDIPDDWDNKLWEKRAVLLLLENTFVKSFQKFVAPSTAEVSRGSRFYRRVENWKFKERGRSGVLDRFSIDRLKQVASLWTDSRLLTPAAGEDLIALYSDSGRFKSIQEHFLVLPDGEIVYGITAFIRLPEDTGTVAYVFRNLKMVIIPKISSSRHDSDCILWSAFCKSTWTLANQNDPHTFGPEEGNELGFYLRSQSIKAFSQESAAILNNLDRDSDRYSRWLNGTMKEIAAKLKDNPDRRPDEMFDFDIFNSRNYDI